MFGKDDLDFRTTLFEFSREFPYKEIKDYSIGSLSTMFEIDEKNPLPEKWDKLKVSPKKLREKNALYGLLVDMAKKKAEGAQPERPVEASIGFFWNDSMSEKKIDEFPKLWAMVPDNTSIGTFFTVFFPKKEVGELVKNRILDKVSLSPQEVAELSGLSGEEIMNALEIEGIDGMAGIPADVDEDEEEAKKRDRIESWTIKLCDAEFGFGNKRTLAFKRNFIVFDSALQYAGVSREDRKRIASLFGKFPFEEGEDRFYLRFEYASSFFDTFNVSYDSKTGSLLDEGEYASIIFEDVFADYLPIRLEEITDDPQYAQFLREKPFDEIYPYLAFEYNVVKNFRHFREHPEDVVVLYDLFSTINREHLKVCYYLEHQRLDYVFRFPQNGSRVTIAPFANLPELWQEEKYRREVERLFVNLVEAYKQFPEEFPEHLSLEVKFVNEHLDVSPNASASKVRTLAEIVTDIRQHLLEQLEREDVPTP